VTPTRSRNLIIGLIIAAVLGMLDILTVLGADGDEGPPVAVGIVLTIVALVLIHVGRREATSPS